MFLLLIIWEKSSLMFPKDINTLWKTRRSIWYFPDPIQNTGKYVSYSRAALWNSIPDDVRRLQNLRNFRMSVNSANM